jgi:hypothetical protein
MVVAGSADDANLKTALPFASRLHVTSKASAGCA